MNYATDTNKYNMKEQELDAVIKFEVMQPGRTNSWEVLTERYGRIVAYQVAQKWPFTVERRLSSENQRGRHLETLESVAEWYTDSGIDTAALEIDSAKTLPLTDCSGPDHLKGMPELETEHIVDSMRIFNGRRPRVRRIRPHRIYNWGQAHMLR